MIDNKEHDHQILSVIANCLSMARSNVTEIKLSLPFTNIVFISYFNAFFSLKNQLLNSNVISELVLILLTFYFNDAIAIRHRQHTSD